LIFLLLLTKFVNSSEYPKHLSKFPFKYLLPKITAIVLMCGLCNCHLTTNQERTKIPPLPNIDYKERLKMGISYLQSAISKSPRSAMAHYKLSQLYYDVRDWNRALESINSALKYSPNNGLMLIAKAKILRELNQNAQAMTMAELARALNVTSPDLFRLLGDLNQRQGDLINAKKYVNKAMQMAPFDGESYYYDGIIRAKEGDTTSALAIIQQSIGLKPNFMAAYVTMTSIYARLGNYEAALAYNNKGIRQFPKESPLYYTRGDMYRFKHKSDSAFFCYQKAYKLDTLNANAAYQAGMIQFKWKNYVGVANYLSAAVRVNPNFSVAYFPLGIAFDKIGNTAKALEAYQNAIKKDPSNATLRRLLARAERRQKYFEEFGVLPAQRVAVVAQDSSSQTNDNTTSETRDTTERIKIDVIAPRLEIKTLKTDTTRELKIEKPTFEPTIKPRKRG
jgi:tetratricopeptide (TPR) repeat protein